MSNTIRRYDPDTDWFEDASPLTLTAVMGGLRVDPREDDPEARQGSGRSVQLTIDGEFIVLTEAQALDLIAVIARRVGCADDFAATASVDELTVHPDGSKEVLETSW